MRKLILISFCFCLCGCAHEEDRLQMYISTCEENIARHKGYIELYQNQKERHQYELYKLRAKRKYME